MKKFKLALIIFLILVLIGGGSGLAYYIYDNTYYFTTEDASVTAKMITLTPEVTGKLLDWQVREGDYIRAGQLLGNQDLSMLVTSSQINSQALSGTADTLIAKSEIKSPINGKVIQSNVLPGQVLSPGMEIAVIADTSNLYINAKVEETDILKIKPGQKVDIKIDAYPGREFTGYVESISDAAQSVFSPISNLSTSGTFSKVTQLIPVKINLVKEQDLKLILGMNVSVKIHLK